MPVEYQCSTVTKMDIDDNIGDSSLFGDGSRLRYEVYALRNSPFRIATLCLGLLCVVLLTGIIGQALHYQRVEQDNQKNTKALTEVKDNLQQNLKTVQNEKRDLETKHVQLEQNYQYLLKKRDQDKTNNDLLTNEANNLRTSEFKLQANNVALTKQLEQLRAGKAQLQTQYDALSTSRDLLQAQYDSVVNSKAALQDSFKTMTRERDIFQNKFNNVTRSKETLQQIYNTLVRDVEYLQGRYNMSTSEKDKITTSHQNLTEQHDTLQFRFNILINATERLRASSNSLIQEKIELEMRLANLTRVRDVLVMKNTNLTAERDQLQAEIERLNTTIQEKRCPPAWRKFENSCYYLSTDKKSWNNSREFCHIHGADLAILTSKEEMAYINTFFGTESDVWIGLSDESLEGHWKWVDGTPLNTTFWAKGQPNSYDGRNQDCVEFWHRVGGIGDWNDEICIVEQNWLCEM